MDKMPDERKIKVVEDKTLGENEWDRRYVVVDAETGEVLDNAQGYGYKSIQNAYKAYSYKSKHKNPKQYARAMKRKVNDFINEHKKFFDDLSENMLEALKEGEEITDKQIKKLIEDNGIVLPFSFSELKRYW